MKTHKPSSKPKGLDCMVCDDVDPSSDRPHYPLPAGSPKWVLRVMRLHKAIPQGKTHKGDPYWGCMSCVTVMGGHKNWPCETLEVVAQGVNGVYGDDQPTLTANNQELRALGVVAGKSKLI